jgi:hypothetical protein
MLIEDVVLIPLFTPVNSCLTIPLMSGIIVWFVFVYNSTIGTV